MRNAMMKHLVFRSVSNEVQRMAHKDAAENVPDIHPHIEDERNFWLIVGGSILGFITITIFFVLLIFFICYRSKKAKIASDADKESLFIRKQILLARYSSSDNGDSPPSLNLPPGFRDNLSSVPVQPKQVGASTSHLIQHSGLLAVAPPDNYGTSDEEDVQSVNSCGKIWFALGYDRNLQLLSVHLVKIRYLKGRGMTHESRDPFVRLYLLPDEINYHQSKVRRRTLAPKFNETFTYQLAPDELSTKTLRLSVYDIDKRNVRHSLGHALVPLTKIEDNSLQTVIWKNLEAVSQKMSQLGELQLSLCCNPYTERIKITVMRAKDLHFQVKDRHLREVFFRVELFYGRKLVRVKETSPQKVSDELDVFQNFSFCVAGKHFESSSLVITLTCRKVSPVSTPVAEAYGRVIVGPFMYARGEQSQHWQDMVANPRMTIERWHHLSEVTHL